MTLGRLLELLNAEKQGHQIMKKSVYVHDFVVYAERKTEIKLTECELQDLVSDGYNDKKFKNVFFFIKDVEDECGDKLLKTK